MDSPWEYLRQVRKVFPGCKILRPGGIVLMQDHCTSGHRMSTNVAESTDLIESAVAGSIDALGELYRRHADAVFATAYRITGSRTEAEDVLQDVFVGLPRALDRYREQGQFGAWLNRLSVRTALMRRRARQRKREEPLESVSPRAQTGIDPVDRMEAEAAVARLPESLRLVFVLKEIEGYSHDEIAGLLGITSNASGARLSRAWARLRKELR